MSKAISRRDFMMVTGVVGRSWSAGCLRRQFFQHCQPLLPWHPLPLLPQTRAWPCRTVPSTMTISWWGGDSRHEAYQNAIRSFQAEHSNITIEPTFAAWSGWEEKMAAAFIAGNAQDVCQVNWNWLYNYSADGSKFVDLNTVSNFLDLTQWDQGCHGCLATLPTPSSACPFP